MLTDQDLFPFGHFHTAGTTMEKVPAGYLDWLQDQPWAKRNYPEVMDYIESNRKIIDMELTEQGRI